MSKPIKPAFDVPPPSPLLSYLRLMRLPNVFTAIADIAMGFLFVNQYDRLPQQWPVLALLIASSALIYTAGMILNDVCDLETDRRERPSRPIPSGQVSLSFALRLGSLFLFNGVMLAAAAGWMHSANQAPPWRSGVVAALLALTVIAYNAWLKRTPLGPLAMGACRLLNVLLGMSAAGIAVPTEAAFLSYHASSGIIALGMCVYVAGVTWFARSEATQSSRTQLILATIVITAGIAILACFAQLPHPDKPTRLPPHMVWLLFGILSLSMLRRAFVAIQDPQPAYVQAMVKHGILSIIVLNAAITLLTTGPVPGLAIAALMLPAFLLGRWVYST